VEEGFEREREVREEVGAMNGIKSSSRGVGEMGK